MSDSYLGEIRMFGGNYAPQGWAFCDGAALAISQNEALFTLLGTTYGGDGEETFNLPDLRGRVPVHQGNGLQMGETAGVETVTLTVNQIPIHMHEVRASTGPGVAATPVGNVTAAPPTINVYIQQAPDVPLDPRMLSIVGNSLPHDNMQPWLCLTFIISLIGIFPPPDVGATDMAEPFLAEIRIFGFNFAPRGWAFCDGQLMSISQNTALFSLLGTTYGGDGMTTYGLPNLQGSVAFNQGRSTTGTTYSLGEFGGSQAVTLLQQEMPAHTHSVQAAGDDADLKAPTPARGLGKSTPGFIYTTPVSTLEPMAPETIGPAGGSEPHNNMMPFLTFNFCIAVKGLFPPRS